MFLLGFLSGTLLWLALAALYYARARRRVKSIHTAIENYQQAQKIVTPAIHAIYPKNPSKPRPKERGSPSLKPSPSTAAAAA